MSYLRSVFRMCSNVTLLRSAWLLSAFFAVSGCAILQEEPSAHAGDLKIPDSVRAALTKQLGTGQFNQLVTLHYQTRQETVQFVISTAPKRLQMVLLTPLGLPLVSVEQTDQHLSVTKHIPAPLPLRAEEMVRDFLLTHLTAASLNRALSPLDIYVEETPAERWVYQNATPMLQISQQSQARGTVRLEHQQLGYRLEIQTLED